MTLAVVPFIWLSVVGAAAREHVEPVFAREYGPVTHGKISAYVEPVRSVMRYGRDEVAPPRETLATARDWAKGYEMGRLQPLPPAFLGDTARSGVKEQIEEARQVLLARLGAVGSQALREKRIADAREASLLILAVSQVNKLADQVTMTNSFHAEIQALRILEPITGTLSRTEREQIYTWAMAEPLGLPVARVFRTELPGRDERFTQAMGMAHQGQPIALPAAGSRSFKPEEVAALFGARRVHRLHLEVRALGRQVGLPPRLRASL